jgi:xanthine/CO dehydrogenase XdhC/CoxF family maturation factor
MAELEREGRRFAVATVVRTVGSTPQVVGAKLLVDDLGRLVGTLGGGCVEGDAFVEAKHVIESGEPSLREYELTEELAWDTGLVCGGTMWISIEPGERVLRFAGRDLLGDVLAASAGGKPVAVATLMRKRGKDVIAAGKLFVESRNGAYGRPGRRDRAPRRACPLATASHHRGRWARRTRDRQACHPARVRGHRHRRST